MNENRRKFNVISNYLFVKIIKIIIEKQRLFQVFQPKKLLREQAIIPMELY